MYMQIGENHMDKKFTVIKGNADIKEVDRVTRAIVMFVLGKTVSQCNI